MASMVYTSFETILEKDGYGFWKTLGIVWNSWKQAGWSVGTLTETGAIEKRGCIPV